MHPVCLSLNEEGNDRQDAFRIKASQMVGPIYLPCTYQHPTYALTPCTWH